MTAVTSPFSLQQLLDNLSTMISEVQLLVQKVEHNHLNSCSNVKDTAKQIFCIIEKFVPELQSSKVLTLVHTFLPIDVMLAYLS